jgi:hypothetical protein
VTLPFSSNKPCRFDDITTIYLPADLGVYDKVLEGDGDPLQTALVHCISRLKATLQSAWLPQSSRVAILLVEPQDFASRLEAHPFTGFYPGYTDGNNPVAIYSALSREVVRVRRVPPPAASIQVCSTTSIKYLDGRLGLDALLECSELLLRLQHAGPEWLQSHGEELRD